MWTVNSLWVPSTSQTGFPDSPSLRKEVPCLTPRTNLPIAPRRLFQNCGSILLPSSLGLQSRTVIGWNHSCSLDQSRHLRGETCAQQLRSKHRTSKREEELGRQAVPGSNLSLHLLLRPSLLGASVPSSLKLRGSCSPRQRDLRRP